MVRKTSYETPPDLFVKELSRGCIEKTICDLLAQGDLENLLNESVFNLGYLPPWTDTFYLTDAGNSLEMELEKELHPLHTLFEKDLTILAKRENPDDILVELPNKQVATVHLTWSSKQEKEDLPVTRLFLNAKDFWQRQMKDDVRNFG